MSDPVNIILGNGQIGKALSKIIPSCIVITRKNLDFSDPFLFNLQTKSLFDHKRISCIINASAFTNVEEAEKQNDIANNINAEAPKLLAIYCNQRQIPLIHFSTDFIFDGTKKTPYTEDDNPNPINFYGLTKYKGEQNIKHFHNKYIIIRVSWVYSAFFKNNFIAKILLSAQTEDEINVVDDQIGGVCNAFDISNAVLKILHYLPNWSRIHDSNNINFKNPDSIWGTYHLAPKIFVNRFNLANQLVKIAKDCKNFKVNRNFSIKPCKTQNIINSASRPLNSMLCSSKVETNFNIFMPDYKQSLNHAIPKMIDIL